MLKNPLANAGDLRIVGLTPGLGRSPGEGNSNPLQYSCLENSMDRGAWWAAVQGRKEMDTTEMTKQHAHYSSPPAFSGDSAFQCYLFYN